MVGCDPTVLRSQAAVPSPTMGSRHTEAEWRHNTSSSITPAQARKRIAGARASRNGASAEAEFDAAAAKWPATCLATCGPIYKRVSKTSARAVCKHTPHVDRVGVIDCIPVCIEIKSTTKDRWQPTQAAFPAHERTFMASWSKSGGLSLLLVRLGAFPYDWRLAEVNQDGLIGMWFSIQDGGLARLDTAAKRLAVGDTPYPGADSDMHCKINP